MRQKQKIDFNVLTVQSLSASQLHIYVELLLISFVYNCNAVHPLRLRVKHSLGVSLLLNACSVNLLN